MKDGLAKSAGVIGAATLTSRILGLVRDQVQAYFFGTDWRADAFVVATRVPTLLRELFAEGAMSAAFVPTFTRTLTREGKDAAFRLGSQVVNGLLLVTGVFVLIGIVFAGPLTESYAKDFAHIDGKLELTIQLTRINMPFLIMIAVAAAFMGMLNALHKFFVPAAAPAMYNVVFILATVLLYKPFEALGMQPVMAMSAGMLGGGLAQALLQWPALRREGYRHQFVLDRRDPALREVLFLMGPGTIGAAAAQINLFVNTSLATGVEGVPAALRYAFLLMYLPIGIFGVSVATATIPSLAKQGAEGAHSAMTSTVSWAIRLMLVLSVPATVGLMVLAQPIVQLIFERGRFDAASTAMTAAALACYAPGIVGYSIVKIASPSFYSLREVRTPLIVSLVTIAVNLGLSVWLFHAIGFKGLALGTAIAANVNAVLLLVFLAKRIGGIELGRILNTLARIGIACVPMALAAWYSHAWLVTAVPGDGNIARAVEVFGAILIAVGALAAAAWALRVQEFATAMSRILGRLRR
jgi:putative peptidoglycan lipid II flippase